MLQLERIHEEIRVLNIKDETLLSFRVFDTNILRLVFISSNRKIQIERLKS